MSWYVLEDKANADRAIQQVSTQTQHLSQKSSKILLPRNSYILLFNTKFIITDAQEQETSVGDGEYIHAAEGNEHEHFEVEDDREPIVRNTFADEQPTFTSTEANNPYAEI